MQLLNNRELTDDSLQIAQALEKQFGSIQQAAKQMGFTRATIYSWIEKGFVPGRTQELIAYRGFDPVTFRRKA